MRPVTAFHVWVAAGFVGAVIGLITGGISELIAYARFLSGVTVYPPNNPIAIAFTHTATPYHLVLAWLLKTGIGEMAFSRIIFALEPALYLQAFALITFAISERFILSLLTGIAGVISLVLLSGADYPINILNAGVVGVTAFAWFLLIPAFAGVGWFRAAAVAATLLAAAHPVFALFGLGLAIVCSVLSLRFRPIGLFRVPWRPAVAGGAVSLILWGVLTLTAPDFPNRPPPDPIYLKAYFDFWDYHRNVPVSIRTLTIAAQGVATIIVLAVAMRPRSGLNATARGMALFLLLGSIAGVCAWALFHALRDVLPYFALIAMPNRLLNVAEIAALPVIVGLLGRVQPRWLAGVFLLSLVAISISSGISLFGGGFDYPIHKLLEHGYAVALALVVSVMLWRAGASAPGVGQRAEQAIVSAVARFTPPIVTPMAVTLALIGVAIWWAPRPLPPQFTDYMKRIEGRVIIAPPELNLDTSVIPNPVLMNPITIDILPYVPGLMPDYADVLRDIYGIDFFDPPDEVRHQGRLPPGAAAAFWRSRTREQWIDLGRRYEADLILTTPDIVLPLERASFTTFNLYFIPR